MQTPIDDRKGQQSTVLEDYHRGHRRKFVDFASDFRELSAGVTASAQLQSEEEVGLINAIVYSAALKAKCGLVAQGDFVACQLEQEVNELPFI